MFNLALIDDTIKIEASQLGLDTITALTYNINAKYSNRILPNVGLCFSHFDYSSISEGHLRNGDGCTYYKVTFRLVVFRPFQGEILLGKVVSSDITGLRISMEFFQDIFVPGELMPAPSAYNIQGNGSGTGEWFWIADTDQDIYYEDPHLSKEVERFYIEQNTPIRFRVEADEFNEPIPKGPKDWKGDGSQAAPTQSEGPNTAEVNSTNQVLLYKIKASIIGNGLGPLAWWPTDDV